VAPLSGGSVVVGIRPQHGRLGQASGVEQVGLKGVLTVSEQLGDAQLLALRLSGKDFLVAGVDPDLTLSPGVPLNIAVAIDNLHVFHPDSGLALR
jgi:ABC-type sugar transport system ATPase subunit